MNYYNLLVHGPLEISDSDWREVLKAVVYYGEAEREPDAALDALQSILFEYSQEWLEKRMRIIRGAEHDSGNASRRSEYCLKSLRNIVSEASKQAERQENSPELSLVERQVSDHLRKLHDQQVVHSCRLRTKQGKDVCNLWGLYEWGSGCRERSPEKHLDRLPEDLPVIKAYQSGKGIFDYGTILPKYIPKMLTIHGAALSTSQIKSVVVSKISPPIVQIASSHGFGEDFIGTDGGHYSEYLRVRSPEDLMAEAESKKAFFDRLTDRERKMLEFKEDGLSIDEIAEKLGCSKRTVNNDWKSIFEKCKEALAA